MNKIVSIIIPVFNEENYISKVISLVLKADLGFDDYQKEIIVVNDGSTDNTLNKINYFKDRIKIINYQINQGKGMALRKGFKAATGEILLIQDADFEYNPKDYKQLIRPIIEGRADVVYGSRFMGRGPHRVLFFWHYAANRFLTLLCNMFSNLNLTDMETGYKAFKKKAIDSIVLKENKFGFEPEVTIKLAQKGYKFYEVGISYYGRDYTEGKKISWIDGINALGVIFRYGFNKRVYIFFLISVLIFSAMAGLIKETVEFIKQIPVMTSQKLPGQKFMPLINIISGEKSVGFISGATEQEYIMDLYQAQYILAPLIIEEGGEPRFIIVSGYSKNALETLMSNQKARLVKELPGNIYLINR